MIGCKGRDEEDGTTGFNVTKGDVEGDDASDNRTGVRFNAGA
jgi:hypothetical protein